MSAPLMERVLGTLLIVATLVVVFALIDLPRALGLFFRFALIGLWFWWVGWTALLGLIILEFIGSRTLIVSPISDYLASRGKIKDSGRPSHGQ